MKKVSVIIAVYNTSRYLVRCLDSVKRQTLSGIEVIIVNDGSTDDSKEICEKYIWENKCDWKIYTKDNGGLSSARRYGWLKSSGECIVFIDSDDEVHSDYCKLLYESMEKTQSQLAICGYNLCNGTSQREFLPDFASNIVEDVLVNYSKRIIFETSRGKRIPGFLWMRMMRRDLISGDCFISENKVFSEDHVFDLEYSRNVERLVFVDKALYNYYINPGSLTLKYRTNMVYMVIQLHSFYHMFLEANGMLDDDSKIKLASNTVQGIISSVVNALRFGSYMDVQEIVRKINSDQRIHRAFKYLRDNSSLSKGQYVWKALLKKHLIFIPYLYYLLKS